MKGGYGKEFLFAKGGMVRTSSLRKKGMKVSPFFVKGVLGAFLK